MRRAAAEKLTVSMLDSCVFTLAGIASCSVVSDCADGLDLLERPGRIEGR
jgi:hypothetical protein